MENKLGVFPPPAMAIGLKNQAASTYCTYGVLLPCRTASWKKLGRLKQAFWMDILLHWLSVLLALLQPCWRLYSGRLKKQASVFLLTTEDTRQQKWLPATLVACGFWVTTRTEVGYQEKETLQGSPICSSSLLGELPALWDKRQEKNWGDGQW